jgi:hypothetical protein
MNGKHKDEYYHGKKLKSNSIWYCDTNFFKVFFTWK